MPKITIHDINCDEYDEDEESKNQLLLDIKNKNPFINEFIQNGKTFEIVFIKKIINRFGGKSCQAVVKLDSEILQKLRDLSASKGSNAVIYTQSTVCKFTNRFHILQYYVCQSFGHKAGSSFCPYHNTSTTICMYCSEHHKSKDCPNKHNKQKHKCANCKRFSNHSEDAKKSFTPQQTSTARFIKNK